jgi:CCR4-NOT complex subunit CAF16
MPASTSALAAPVEGPAIVLDHLNFSYGVATGFKPVLTDVTFSLPRGARCLLVGDNGAGKSSLLRILAGRHIHPEGAVTTLGASPFYDSSELNHRRAFLSTEWGRKTSGFAGQTALNADIAVGDMMEELQRTYADRRAFLADLLGVDLTWRMHQLSDGQRRRVQCMLQLLRPVDLLMLDEITTDLDVITRQVRVLSGLAGGGGLQLGQRRIRSTALG